MQPVHADKSGGDTVSAAMRIRTLGSGLGSCAFWLATSLLLGQATACRRVPPCQSCERDFDCDFGLECALVVSSGPDQGHAGRVCKRKERKDPGGALEPPTCNADCRNDCRNTGQCVLIGERCTVQFDADCKGSEICKNNGQCSVKAFPDGKVCWAKDDADCAASKGCRENGRCFAYGRGTGLLGCGAKSDVGVPRD